MEKANTDILSKIELFHDSERTYYYDMNEGQLYLQNQNTLKYREQSKKLLENATGISLTIGLISIIINKWYRSIATFQTQFMVLFLGLVLFLFLWKYLNDFIKKHMSDYSISIPLHLQLAEVEDLLDKSTKTANSFKNICLISFLSAAVGLVLFLKFSILIGLALTIISLLLSLAILKYLNISGRYKAINHLRNRIIEVTNQKNE
ncbi:hypothetical protein [Enterococcus columbae]|uniref:Tandem five-TM protein n=1 Tax=Enterococcus columbae DSM 7374 = ATCC 51263 TaxID=1121865 RepID=S1P3T5_9ENTE|nr:hypothetical protein [Enterococcus columbae]EOT38590.1 hypothetical protein OMW_02230 [Enterococcus columbae DSM 7374 = ATCC 51263]EOW87759.1 hypothetical protein I568_00045 [Enterococcus columbae DSM 7374 = ATCC 51263]OJG21657.1 hypothetical protein RR47_GL001211 [Enterococcus columbae DSM 7374 = ATCC 51263]